MTKNYNWGIIGCGSVTEIKSGPAYQKVDGFNLHAVMRRDIEKAKDYAFRHQVPKFYGDADALINDPEIDAIYIATPPDSHTFYALKVAAAGKVCCIEKPMATAHKECLQINAAFDAKNIPLFVAYYRRSLPRFNQIKSWINENKIGQVRHVNWHLSKPANDIDISKKYNWRTDYTIAKGGYFDDLASHGIDLLIHFLGDIKNAQGIATNQQGLYTAMDAITSSWLHTSGVTGSGSWNFGSEKREDLVQIYGEKGKISFSVFDENPIVLEHGNHKETLSIEHPENIQLFHVQNMQHHLAENNKHPSTGKTAAQASWVLESILKNNH
ncbi:MULTISPECIES: Gfo/Idh/MocA family protein [unclassified Polaribacter]|uniref:Gfo/Idh/MocA family protein n=1 Tax=unclassified Polaribacter TaxID=196858 RepID=UPI0011BD742B|nr:MULTISPECIES: Gfo/Idh/MocA family oxidoreductase [unclassified Polaribacter]TXD53538.1 Gfo/Idh/MocA family oxidoreductase [Polaribacter sp. IC063]TXD58610.1 Gfo/Idh/MocA family oxidoreductase [Polaribacter sp. IC066]